MVRDTALNDSMADASTSLYHKASFLEACSLQVQSNRHLKTTSKRIRRKTRRVLITEQNIHRGGRDACRNETHSRRTCPSANTGQNRTQSQNDEERG